MTNAAVKRDSLYTLKIVHDEDVESPREWDNIGKMVCFHNRYSLGDKHDYSEPRDFLRNMLFERYSGAPDYGKPVYDFIKQGRAQEARLEYDRSSREWGLLENNHWSSGNDWYSTSSYPASLKGADIPDWFLDDALSALRIDELIKLVEEIKDIEISPLYLYDHGGITISMSDFNDRWDSGQVGWIYINHSDIAKEYGDASPANIEKAQNLLAAEVKDYDSFIRGDCFGFQLFDKKGEQLESCWGFLGDFDEALKSISEYLPEDAKRLAESAEYGDDDPEVEKKPSILAQVEKNKEIIKSQSGKTATAKKEDVSL